MELVFGASRYDMKDDDGIQITGAKIAYIDLETSEFRERNIVGCLPILDAAPYDMFAELEKYRSELPAFFDLAFAKRPNGKLKSQLMLKSAKFLGKAKIDLIPAKV